MKNLLLIFSFFSCFAGQAHLRIATVNKKTSVIDFKRSLKSYGPVLTAAPMRIGEHTFILNSSLQARSNELTAVKVHTNTLFIADNINLEYVGEEGATTQVNLSNLLSNLNIVTNLVLTYYRDMVAKKLFYTNRYT